MAALSVDRVIRSAQGGFENPWHITAPLQEPGKQLLVFARQGKVMSVLVERAQVHMAQAVSKAVEERSALFKRRVDLLRVSYVEAQAGERQLVEDRRQLVNRLARLLSGVHVLDDEAPPDGLPGVEVLEQIGVHHDRANS
jgi:tetrahydromethanopterin S-methyltransferase subunit F